MINCFKDPIHVLMRVLLCKIHCSLFCFCKPFSHIYAKSSLKLENTPHASLKTLVSAINDDHQEVVNHVDGHRNDVRAKEEEEDDDIVEDDSKEDEGQSVGDTLTLKSSLRNFDSNLTEAEKKMEKKKVQWVDVMGIKDLAEIREFEPRLVFLNLRF